MNENCEHTVYRIRRKIDGVCPRCLQEQLAEAQARIANLGALEEACRKCFRNVDGLQFGVVTDHYTAPIRDALAALDAKGKT